MIPCQRYEEQIFALFDGELDSLQAKKLKQHFKACPRCSRFYDQIRLLRSNLQSLTPVKAPESFHFLLRERIRRENAGKVKKSSVSIYFNRRTIPALGFFIILIGMGLWVMDHGIIGSKGRGFPTQASQDVKPGIENLGEETQYVIDEYPGRLSVSRPGTMNEAQLADKDTLVSPKDSQRRSAPVTLVAF